MQGVCCFKGFKEWCFLWIFSSTDMHLQQAIKRKLVWRAKYLYKYSMHWYNFLQVRTFFGKEPSSDCIYVPAPTLAKKRQPTSSFEECWLSPLMETNGRFGQARTPNTTFPSSSNASAIAYWSPLRNLLQNMKHSIDKWMH